MQINIRVALPRQTISNEFCCLNNRQIEIIASKQIPMIANIEVTK